MICNTDWDIQRTREFSTTQWTNNTRGKYAEVCFKLEMNVSLVLIFVIIHRLNEIKTRKFCEEKNYEK